METTKYSAPLDLKLKIQDMRSCTIFSYSSVLIENLNVLASLRYYNLFSCSIIYTEETEPEEYA